MRIETFFLRYKKKNFPLKIILALKIVMLTDTFLGVFLIIIYKYQSKIDCTIPTYTFKYKKSFLLYKNHLKMLNTRLVN